MARKKRGTKAAFFMSIGVEMLDPYRFAVNQLQPRLA